MLFLILLACAPSTDNSAENSAAPASSPAGHKPAAGDSRRAAGGKSDMGHVDNEHPTSTEGFSPTTTSTGLTYWTLKEGTGVTPTTGQTVAVHYSGWLKDGGKKFDSSLDRGRPIEFPVGTGGVIPGWDEAVGAMKVGEHRMLEIPPTLGYGDRGAGGVIPGGATLLFDVELMAVQ